MTIKPRHVIVDEPGQPFIIQILTGYPAALSTGGYHIIDAEPVTRGLEKSAVEEA